MKSWMHIALLVVGLGLNPLASAQPASAQQASAAAVKQSEARLGELDRAIAELQAQQAQLLDEARMLKAQLDRTRKNSGSALANSERNRLLRRANALEQRRQALAAKLDGLEQQRRSISSAIDQTPAGKRRQLEETERAETTLRHKARLVAAKIRQLRNQQRLAGDVMRTVREQALFDEEERKLSVSRVVANPSGSPTAAAQNNGQATGGGGQSPATPPNEFGEYGGAGNAADPGTVDDGASLDTDTRSGGECVGAACGTPAKLDGTGVSMSYSVVSGNRLNTLLDQNVETLLGDGSSVGDLAGSPEELKKLEALRVELLRSADELARKRAKLEIEARNTPH